MNIHQDIAIHGTVQICGAWIATGRDTIGPQLPFGKRPPLGPGPKHRRNRWKWMPRRGCDRLQVGPPAWKDHHPISKADNVWPWNLWKPPTSYSQRTELPTLGIVRSWRHPRFIHRPVVFTGCGFRIPVLTALQQVQCTGPCHCSHCSRQADQVGLHQILLSRVFPGDSHSYPTNYHVDFPIHSVSFIISISHESHSCS